MFLDLDKGTEKLDSVTVWGGCAALVRLLKDRLKKALKKSAECDQIKESNELPELGTIANTLHVIVNLSFYSEIGRVGIATVGGAEAVVKAMKTFPIGKHYSSLQVVSWATWHVAALARRKPSNRMESRFFLPL